MKPALLLAPLLGAALMGGSTVSTGAAARVASGGVARAGAVVPAPGGNALRAHRRLYVNRESAAAQAARELAAQGRGDDAGLLRWLAAQPTAIWFTGNTTDAERLRVVMRKANATRTVPVVVAYNIPFRDCGGQSAIGPHALSGQLGALRDGPDP